MRKCRREKKLDFYFCSVVWLLTKNTKGNLFFLPYFILFFVFYYLFLFQFCLIFLTRLLGRFGYRINSPLFFSLLNNIYNFEE